MEINFDCPVCERIHSCDNYGIQRIGGHVQWCCSEDCALKLRQYFDSRST